MYSHFPSSLCRARDKPSTWFPRGRLVEQAQQKAQEVAQKAAIAYAKAQAARAKKAVGGFLGGAVDKVKGVGGGLLNQVTGAGGVGGLLGQGLGGLFGRKDAAATAKDAAVKSKERQNENELYSLEAFYCSHALDD